MALKCLELFFILFQIVLISCSSINNPRCRKFRYYFKGEQQLPERQLTREIVDKFAYPLIFVKSNGILLQALMLPQTTRGVYTNYITGSGQGLTMYGSLISKTQGLDINLISLETNNASGLIKREKPEDWPLNTIRRYKFVTPLYAEIYEEFKCKLHKTEALSLEIVEINFNVQKLQEICISANSKFTNIYWVDNTGIIRKSIQHIPIQQVTFTIENLSR